MEARVEERFWMAVESSDAVSVRWIHANPSAAPPIEFNAVLRWITQTIWTFVCTAVGFRSVPTQLLTLLCRCLPLTFTNERGTAFGAPRVPFSLLLFTLQLELEQFAVHSRLCVAARVTGASWCHSAVVVLWHVVRYVCLAHRRQPLSVHQLHALWST
jgi:hypothetical protein